MSNPRVLFTVNEKTSEGTPRLVDVEKDHWAIAANNSTIITNDNADPAGSLAMDGPKQITAIWKVDYRYVGIIQGIALAAVPLIRNCKDGSKLLFYHRTKTHNSVYVKKFNNIADHNSDPSSYHIVVDSDFDLYARRILHTLP